MRPQPQVTGAIPYRGPVPPSSQPRMPGGVWLMGCHGGAGVSTLAAFGIGVDAGWRRWPQLQAAPAGLLLVARLSASGMRAAAAAAETCLSPHLPQGLRLLGLVVVAAEPGRRPPQLARERLELVTGWVPAVFRVPWVPLALAIDTDPASVARCDQLRRAIPKELLELVEATRSIPC